MWQPAPSTEFWTVLCPRRFRSTTREPLLAAKKPETLEEAIGRARAELRGVYRAVTPDDYESLALKTPGLSVARAKAIPLYHPSQPGSVPDTVTIIVVPKSHNPMPIPGLDFLKTVYRYLDLHRTIGTELFVIPPIYRKDLCEGDCDQDAHVSQRDCGEGGPG